MEQASRKLLAENKLKVTAGRVLILRLLMANHRPLTIEEIRQLTGSKVDLVTIYRTLDKLVKAQLIYQTDFRDGKAYFEFQAKHHHHIACLECGAKEEVSVCLDQELERVERHSKLFPTIQSHVLEFFGLCRHCQN